MDVSSHAYEYGMSHIGGGGGRGSFVRMLGGCRLYLGDYERRGDCNRSCRDSEFVGEMPNMVTSYGGKYVIITQCAIITNRCAAVPSCQKTAIFPETREGNMHSSNESARGWLLREANV